MAAALPRMVSPAFCPTTVACDPDALRGFLQQVARARLAPAPLSARVLPAHLESNFLNPEYAGAQPVECLRVPADADARTAPTMAGEAPAFSGREILAAIAAGRADIGIVTVAPELDGGVELVRALCADGHRVALGHSGADYDVAVACVRGWRPARHAPVQPDDADDAPRARPGRARCSHARTWRRS
jgi:N-acetylglucosamine-6-phosphate deacetylase